jgi:hypothetical protein
VFIKTADDYPAATLIARDPRMPGASAAAVSAKDVATFKKRETLFVRNIDGKVAKVPAKDDDERVGFREKLLVYHLESSNYLEELRQKFPPQWEDLDSLIDAMGESISTEAFVDKRAADQRLMETRSSLEKTLAADHAFIRTNERLLISWGTVSKWLGECPLDFPEVSNV